MNARWYGLLVFCWWVLPVVAQTHGTILTFTSDKREITPDAAESGEAFIDLQWSTTPASGETVHLQVLVLGEWHEIQNTGLAAQGTLHWAVPHTLDFIPPTFRLVLQDSSQQVTAEKTLEIPYSTIVDAQNPPQIVRFTSSVSSVNATTAPNGVIPIVWQVRNRPARANLVFEQLLDTGKIVSAELPRSQRWIRSSGEGAVKVQPDGASVLLRVTLANIDNGEVYAQKTLSVVVEIPPTVPNIGTTSTSAPPQIVSFALSNYTPKRGETIAANWDVQGATQIIIELRSIDYFPRGGVPAPAPEQRFADLPATGSVNITVPADTTLSGWQVHFIVLNSANIANGKRLDVIFGDMPQPILLNIRQFVSSKEAALRGEKITLTWDVFITTRTSINGIVNYDQPVNGYDDMLFIEYFGVILGQAVTASSPLNQRMTRLAKQGSLEIPIPNYELSMTSLYFNLGVEVNNEFFTSGVLNITLTPPANLAQIEQVPMAYQPFEHGFMLWDARNGDVKVYQGFNGGQTDVYIQAVYGALPDNPITETVPTGKWKPINAFGRVWGNYGYIRDTLGWAVGAEQGYTATVESSTTSGELIVTITLPNNLRIWQRGVQWGLP